MAVLGGCYVVVLGREVEDMGVGMWQVSAEVLCVNVGFDVAVLRWEAEDMGVVMWQFWGGCRIFGAVG